MSLDTSTLRPQTMSVAGNTAVIAAISGHHAQLAEELRTLTDAVIDAAPSGAYQAARKQLLGWYTNELLPHALAEERALYRPAQDLPATQLLVHGMLAEHRELEQAILRISNADSPVAMVASAAAAHAVFTIHLSKENDLLLPALDAAEVDLAEVLAGMHEILGGPATEPAAGGCGCGGCGCEDAASDDAELLQVGTVPRHREDALDLRSLPHDARHEIIFTKLDDLAIGASLVIYNDHDPKPLKYQTEALWPHCFEWNYIESGPMLWRVAITRVG